MLLRTDHEIYILIQLLENLFALCGVNDTRKFFYRLMAD